MALTPAARGIWVSVLSWSCQQRCDAVPTHLLTMVGGSKSEANELVKAGLWVECDEGWRIHDWADYQDRSLSEKRAAAGRKGGIASGESRSKDEANEANVRSKRQAKAEAGPSLPVPTQPKENPIVDEASTGGLFPVPGTPSRDVAREIFDAWVESTGRDPTRTRFTTERRRLIAKWSKTYDADELKAAVRGWRHDPHLRGENDRRKPYNDLELLLRDAKHIEMCRDLELDHMAAPVRVVASWLA